MDSLRRAAAAALLVFAPAAYAQSKVDGQWTVRFALAYVNLHTGDTTISPQTAVMSLHTRGDSVLGFWQTPVAEGETAPPVRTVRGTIRGDSVRVQVDPPPHDDGFFAELGQELVEWLKTHIHNMPPTIPLLEFTVRGDSLAGTRRTMTIEGEMRTQPAKIVGARRRTVTP